MDIIIDEAKQKEIFEECIKQGAKESNLYAQFYRMFSYPEKVAQVLIREKEMNKWKWLEPESPKAVDDDDILASETNYIKYMKDNITLLMVLKKKYPDSDLNNNWEKAAKMLEDGINS